MGPFFARRSLGQNFLTNPKIARKLVALAGDIRSGSVIEVGAGTGMLTRALLDAGASNIVAVETDPRLIGGLGLLASASDEKLRVVQGDARRIDLTTLGPAPRRIVSNLPYNVGTHLLTSWLQQLAVQWDAYDFFVLTFQKEVAQRIAAQPNSSAYGRLSVLAGWLLMQEGSLDISAGSFCPRPRVDSRALALRPRARPFASAYEAPLREMEKITSILFNQRRKMLRSNLRARKLLRLLGARNRREEVQQPKQEDRSDSSERSSVIPDFSARPQTLTIQDFCALARLLAASTHRRSEPLDCAAPCDRDAQDSSPKSSYTRKRNNVARSSHTARLSVVDVPQTPQRTVQSRILLPKRDSPNG